MTRTIGIIAALLLSALIANDAQGQWNVARFGAEQSRVYTTVGMDPAIVSSVGYARVVSMLDHHVQLSSDIGVASAGLDADDFRVRMGMQTSLVRWRSTRVTGSATFITRGTENSIYRGINFGSEFTGTVGVYRNRWFASGEAGFDKAIVTHMRLSDYYRDNYYPDAKDGWYLDAGGTYHYGVTGGFAVRRTEIMMRGGWHTTERFNRTATPFYASLGVGFGF